MRRVTPLQLLRATCVSLALAACTAPESMPPHVPADLERFARDYTAAWCSQDPARVAGFFAADGSLTINDAEPSVGRAAITADARGFMEAFPDMVVSMDALEVDDASVLYRWTLTGTNTGPGGTGRAVEIHGFEAWTFGADGLIARSQGHFDAAEYARQLEHGAEPDP